jgi:amidohydrolase
MIEAIQQKAAAISEKIISYRRHLHAHPELSFHEYETSAFIKSKLDEIGVAWKAVAGTGVLAIIKGELPSDKVIALRADMDALPITEANQCAYTSTNPGVMHACGHDFHTASLLGTAEILQSLRHAFGGQIKLLFQPAEEVLPGGALQMIAEGVLKDPVPSTVIGQHVSPFLEAGKIAVRKGMFMASMDELFVTVRGKGGHGAQPHRNIDPVMIAAQMLVSLQQLVSRNANPSMPTVLSFGKVIANGAINVIPDEIYIEGTFRTMNEDWRNEAHQRMKTMAEGIAQSMGGSCEFNINRGYPFLVNDTDVTDHVTASAAAYLGSNNVTEAEIWMAAEDFARYSQQVPSCFYLLGTGNQQKGITSSLHTSTFDVDEDVLVNSMGLMAWVAVKALKLS